MMMSMGVPAQFWGEAMATAVYNLNRAPTRSLNGRTPYEAWRKKWPSAGHLRTFGCTVFAKRVGPGMSKLADRSVPGVFFSYEPGTKAYWVYDPVEGRLIVSRNVIFDEKKPWNWVAHGAPLDGATGTFTVEYTTIVGRPTTGAGDVPSLAMELGSPATPSPLTPAAYTYFPTPASSTPMPTPAPGVQLAMPPTEGTVDSDGVALRFRTLPNLFDTTEGIHDFEYSGLRLLAAEEPGSVEETLAATHWRRAMEAEMESIPGSWPICQVDSEP
jgi:hypothetical protein